MSSDVPPPSGPTPGAGPQQPLLERLGLSGQLIGGGSIVGIISLFLPWVSTSTNIQASGLPFGGGGGLNVSQSISAIKVWQGDVCLLAYIAAIVLVLVVYPTKTPEQKPLAWGALGAGALALLLAFWLIAAVPGGGADLGALGSVKQSAGFGAYLNLIAAGVVTYGGYLKAREERVL